MFTLQHSNYPLLPSLSLPSTPSPVSILPSNRSNLPPKQLKWTISEDILLQKLVESFGENQWRKVSQQIPNRTSIQCMHRWSKIARPDQIKGQWTILEDEKLKAFVNEYGPTNWSKAAALLGGRTGRQCRERWLNCLNPEINRGEWTEEEDRILVEKLQDYGSSWCKIAKFLPGRTENAIKNRFYSHQRRSAVDKKRGGAGESILTSVKIKESKRIDIGAMKLPTEAYNALYKLLEDAKIDQKFVSVSTGVGSDKRKAAEIEANDEQFEKFLISSWEKENVPVKEDDEEEDELDKLQKKIFLSYGDKFEETMSKTSEKFKEFEEQSNSSPKQVGVLDLSQSISSNAKSPVQEEHGSGIKRHAVTVLTHTPTALSQNKATLKKKASHYPLYQVSEMGYNSHLLNPFLYSVMQQPGLFDYDMKMEERIEFMVQQSKMLEVALNRSRNELAKFQQIYFESNQ